MKRLAYFDTFSGMSGDMVLGALLDAGLALEDLRSGLGGLSLGGFRLEAETVRRGAFKATRARVVIDGREHHHEAGHHHHEHAGHGHEHGQAHDHAHGHGHGHAHEHGHDHAHGHGHDHDHAHAPDRAHGHSHEHAHGHAQGEEHVHAGRPAHAHTRGAEPHRHLPDILEILSRSRLPSTVREQAAAVFRRLAEAEARVHGVPVESVHFHEVGAVDSIVDIVGSCLGLHLLGVEEVHCSPAAVGRGFVESAHGRIPLPAPATLELLKGFPVEARDTGHELTTPTGAALATTLGRSFGPLPSMTVRGLGYGAGDDRPGPTPNVLRLVLGEAREGAPAAADRVVCLETAVDDMSPEWIGYVVDRLLEAGALDVAVTPVLMKKTRSAHEIRVLAPPAGEERCLEVLFSETTTFGIRRSEVERLVLERALEPVSTPWGEVRIKVGRRGGRVMSASPEYEDVQRAARAGGVPLKEVHRRALEEFHRRLR